MLNPNKNRPNTMISQSFIASEFQDPYSSSGPTSSLNQFVRSNQTSNSGFHNEAERNQQSFGFGNITNTSSNGNFSNENNAFSRNNSSNAVLNAQSREQIPPYQPQPQQFAQQPMSQPQQLNERYVSPGIVKIQSSRIQQSQFQHEQNPQGQSQFRPQQTDSFEPYRPPQNNNQFSASSNRNIAQSQQNSTAVGRRLKLNVSEEFSNSFTLKCVNEPQKSSILDMKKRQREFRRNIQNHI